MVFSVGIDFFFTRDHAQRVLAISRHDERLKFPEGAKASEAAYLFESLDFGATERKLNAFYAEFQAIDPTKVIMHQHDGVEFLYVLAGRLGVRIGYNNIFLDGRDSIYFDSGVAHGYWSATRKKTTAIVITVP